MRIDKKLLSVFLLLGIGIALFSCSSSGREGVEEEQFAKYWYQGKAEINVFDLQQSRYGEVRPGKAVMIFVTEDFSKKKQVKLDNPQDNPNDAQKVLKLNMTREFLTGVYPYHTMLSVFTPVYEEASSPKLSASVTEWCGQSYTQMNFKNGNYSFQQFSYFESEGDQSGKTAGVAEEEIFNLIRLNPELVPMGNVKMIPSLIFQRFAHIPLKGEQATISKKDLGQNQSEIEVVYNEIGRKISIRYQQFFPFEILGFTETWTKANGQQEVTTATRSNMQMMDYWNKNEKLFEPLRKDLGL
ncbi:hypothetical protein DFQ04_0163 [Algoriphagus boseongensis]|uniref:Septum formation inhibitor Maf n=1 Tax=Algoriphagus boseongensis TaxID=1442587 RepID=A0A4R6TA90_9BACT|nr:hypothetical protein [Algoriphagus boseongensis]TDQ18364.1 hypothetical protein DFQ04_0163 [Algoriphagus boseongensis]